MANVEKRKRQPQQNLLLKKPAFLALSLETLVQH